MKQSLASRLYAWAAEKLDLWVGWDKLPVPLALAVLGGLRITLRRDNLYDTESLPSTRPPVPKPADDRYLISRTADGTYNDLDNPHMGSAGARFGRNVPNASTYQDPEMLTPNPRTVSRELLTRDRFVPATTLNLLAASWLQFMVHDWLSHGPNEKDDPWLVPIADDDDWPERPMKVLRTRRDPTRPPNTQGAPLTFANMVTHWWDASQLYGSDAQRQHQIRSHQDGKVVIGSDGLLPIDPDTGTDLTGVTGNYWVPLSVMHTLFSHEHNAICDRLRADYPTWSDDDLFERARLINAALLAKIHTVEWTPAIIAHPTTVQALRANWFGLAGENIKKVVGSIGHNDILSGIPGSNQDHFGVPYTLTEEFLAVYKMHPLIPDDFSFRSAEGDTLIKEYQLPDILFQNSRTAMETIGLVNAIYSCGTMNPGAITLHNFPRGLQHMVEKTSSGDTVVNDVATIDILRMRERGVPRYNEFRRFLHKPPVRSFEELTDNPQWREDIRRIYNNDINQVDLMIGLYTEKLPEGFGFSDTAFRIFILMASRRLNSDRFFTTDWTPKVYTPAGMEWLTNTDFSTVLIRHFPSLAPLLRQVDNPFAPWPRAKVG
jgi:hypothetical protein